MKYKHNNAILHWVEKPKNVTFIYYYFFHDLNVIYLYIAF